MSSQIDHQSQASSDQVKSSGISVPLQSLSFAESLFDTTTPITMVNLLRFHTAATYPADSDHSSTTPSIPGREVYLTRYVPAFRAIASKISTGSTPITPIFIGAPTHSLVTEGSVAIDMGTSVNPDTTDGSGDAGGSEWDMIGLISYPSLDAFRTLITSPEYLATAQPHRLASLKDWRLIVTKAVES